MASGESVIHLNEVEEPDITLNPSNGEEPKKPYVGMAFSSIEEAHLWYQDYGRESGFSVRKRSSHRTLRGPQITRVLFTCSCEGLYKRKCGLNDEGKTKKSGSTMRTDCKARIRIARDKHTGEWLVNEFREDHNHALVIPTKRVLLRTNMRMPAAARDLAETISKENLHISTVTSIFGESFSNIAFDSRDCSNHLKAVRHRLEARDVQAVLDYFRKKTIENPHFHYAIQCDEDGRATNFFWVDARSRMAYSHFGDVVTFDTTYRTDKYNMAFAPFTGVNHHNQSILFGCALLQDETEDTFVWLFQTWIEAMGGRHPISIITNQDLAISAAVGRMFHNARHCFFLWHIKKKLTEKLSQVFFNKSKLKQSIKKCILDTYTVDDFEKQWATMLVEFGLEGNEWLKHLYDIRQTWIPVFNRGTFFAGMNSTKRSESINAFFEDIVTSKTYLKDFFIKYEQALDIIYVNEQKEDCISLYKKRILNSGDLLLRHAAETYTRNIFDKFQSEFDAMCLFRVDEIEKDGDDQKYKVQLRVGNQEEFFVKMNMATKEGLCGCQLFEFMGIPCRHMLRVFDRLYLDQIPSHFILKRWTKDANRTEVISSDGLLTHVCHIGSEAMRISHLCRQSTQLAYLAGRSKEAYTVAMRFLHEAFEKVLQLDDVASECENTDKLFNDTCRSSTDTILLDLHNPQAEGGKRVEEGKDKTVAADNSICGWKSGIEISEGRKKPRICETFTHHGHDSCNYKQDANIRMTDSNDAGLDIFVTDLGDDGADRDLEM